MGVLMDVIASHLWVDKGEDHFPLTRYTHGLNGGTMAAPQGEILHQAGISPQAAVQIIYWNDQAGMTFSEIADLIERDSLFDCDDENVLSDELEDGEAAWSDLPAGVLAVIEEESLCAV